MGGVNLVIYAAVVKNSSILEEYYSAKAEWRRIGAAALDYLPSNHHFYTLSFEGYMIVFLRQSPFVYLLMCHEALGRSLARDILDKMSNEHVTRKKDHIMNKLKPILVKYKGDVVPFKPLEVYPDAPKAYTIKFRRDDSSDEETPGRKSLQEELDELNDDKGEIIINSMRIPNPQIPPIKILTQRGGTVRPLSGPKTFVRVDRIMLPPGFSRQETATSSDTPSDKSRKQNPYAQGGTARSHSHYLEVEVPQYFTSVVHAKESTPNWSGAFPPTGNKSHRKAAKSPLSLPEFPNDFHCRESNGHMLQRNRPVSDIHFRDGHKHATSTFPGRLGSDASKSEGFSVPKAKIAKSRTTIIDKRHKSGESARISPEEALATSSMMKGRIAPVAPSGLPWEMEIPRLINSGRSLRELAKSTLDKKSSASNIVSAPVIPNSASFPLSKFNVPKTKVSHPPNHLMSQRASPFTHTEDRNRPVFKIKSLFDVTMCCSRTDEQEDEMPMSTSNRIPRMKNESLLSYPTS